MSKPAFRFFPTAYDIDGVFEATNDACEVCKQPSGYRYTGEVYAEGSAPEVCASCIHSGKLAAAMDDKDMQLVEAELAGVDADTAREVLQRTPGFSTFNGFDWPVIDGKPLAFLGYGDSGPVTGDAAATASIEAAWKDSFEDPFEGPTANALVFRTLDGKTHKVVFDFD